MKRFVLAAIMSALACGATSAMADNAPKITTENPHPFRAGFGIDVGVPSGAAVSFVFHPMIDWASASVSLTHNALNFGGRFSIKMDPMALMPKLPIGLFADFQGGFAMSGSIPGNADLPSVGYDYFSTYLGLRLGRPNGFHWLIEAGPSFVYATTDKFQSVMNNSTNGLTLGNPTISAWVVPTFITGFEVIF